jgi:hypothetical protein
MADKPVVDPELKKWAAPRQAEYIDAINEAGSVDAGARALKMDARNIRRGLQSVKARAARDGYAPGHFTAGTAPGYLMGKVTIQRGPEGVERVWERQHPDAEAREAAFVARLDALADKLPRAAPLSAPGACNADLLTIYPQGDPHAGLYAWADETGQGFDLAEYERVNRAATDQLVASAPPSAQALFIDLGDSTHADDNTNRTRRSGNVLDVHGRHAEAIRINMRVKRYQVARLLEKHLHVTVRVNPGNHDPETALVLAMMLEAHYEHEPRVTVVTSPNPYWYMGFGSNLIGTTHGDGAKGKDLPLLMAVDQPKLWAASEEGLRLWLVGHVHHKDAKDYPGVLVEYCRTLAAPDAWSNGAGHRSKRTMEAITLHRHFGEAARAMVGLGQINRLAA